jgi:hypothetical protein
MNTMLADKRKGWHGRLSNLLILEAHSFLDSRLNAMIAWLFPELFHDIHDAVRGERQCNTGQWFVDEVLAWLNSGQHPFFCCRGNR